MIENDVWLDAIKVRIGKRLENGKIHWDGFVLDVGRSPTSKFVIAPWDNNLRVCDFKGTYVLPKGLFTSEGVQSSVLNEALCDNEYIKYRVSIRIIIDKHAQTVSTETEPPEWLGLFKIVDPNNLTSEHVKIPFAELELDTNRLHKVGVIAGSIHVADYRLETLITNLG